MPSLSVDFTSPGLPDSEILYCSGFLSEEEASELFNELRQNVPWQEDSIKLFGKTYSQPRLTAFYGNNGQAYRYSGICMHPHPFTYTMLRLKEWVEVAAKAEFTSCLLNLYRHGNDSNGWHSDNEKELGEHPHIASVSLGAVRTFQLKHRKVPGLKHAMALQNGSLLLMKGATQKHWLHQVPKTKKKVGARINLTFRLIH